MNEQRIPLFPLLLDNNIFEWFIITGVLVTCSDVYCLMHTVTDMTVSLLVLGKGGLDPNKKSHYKISKVNGLNLGEL